MELEKLLSRIKEVADKVIYTTGDDGGIEIYTDYRDRELSDTTLKEICNADNPQEYFDNLLWEWADNYAYYPDCGYYDIEREIKKNLTDEELECWEDNEDEVWDYLKDSFYFYYDENDFNTNVEVNIEIDVGNANYDFTCDHVLDWYADGHGYYEKNNGFHKNSSILWLAKQQGRCKELRQAARQTWNHSDRTTENKFVLSCIQELENSCSLCTTLTFLVSMPLLTFLALKENINAESNLNKSYTYEPRKSKGYLILDKSVMCGLFDRWNGSGSVLEIECEKDIKIPFKAIHDIRIDGTKRYDVGEVYGMYSDAWTDCLKEVHHMSEKEIKVLESEVA